MDPNQTLVELRAFAARINGDDETACDAAADAETMATLFQALDEWLSNRGFLPFAWGRGRPNMGNAK